MNFGHGMHSWTALAYSRLTNQSTDHCAGVATQMCLRFIVTLSTSRMAASCRTDRTLAISFAAPRLRRILRGAKPAELPGRLPVKFEMALNMKVAKTIGLDVPPTLLALANEVIE
jgi:hypothetical protein